MQLTKLSDNLERNLPVEMQMFRQFYFKNKGEKLVPKKTT